MVCLCDKHGDNAPVLAGVFEIEVTEGNASKTFIISKALLERRAPSLANYILDRKGPVHKFIELTDVNIETFNVFIHWVSVDEVDEMNRVLHEPLFSTFASHVSIFNSFDMLLPIINIYLFGVSYDISNLRKDAMYRLTYYLGRSAAKSPFGKRLAAARPPGSDRRHFLEAVVFTHANTEPNSPLRPMLVDGFCAAMFTTAVTADWLKEFPTDFLAEVMCRKDKLGDHEERRNEAYESLKKWRDGGEDRGRKRQRRDSGAGA